MFESLLERILTKILGNYVTGIDSNNLKIGIWSGNVVIQNVSIKPEVLQLLELPIQLSFSHIGKLQLTVPWKYLGSQPVELFLDGLYLILSPINQQNWTFQDYKGLQKKIEMIENYTQECLKKLIEKEKENLKKASGQEDPGYIQKLTMKIIDNLQVQVSNIHIRYEDSITNIYSWGITLETLQIFTTNKQGEKKFIDRTDQANKGEPMRKTVILSKLGVYWNSQENQMISQQKDVAIIQQLMSQVILKEQLQIQAENAQQQAQIEKQKYMLVLSFEAKLLQHEKGNFDNPEIELNFNMQKINFQLLQTQLQQIICMAEFFSKYQQKLAIEKKTAKNITEEQRTALLKQFSIIYTKMMNNEKDKTFKGLSKKEQDEYELSLLSLEIDDLLTQTKNVIIEIEKEKKLKELEKNKQKDKKGGGMLGWFWGGGSQQKGAGSENDELITDEDRKKMDQFFKENFQEETKVVRPKEYVWFVLKFSLEGLQVYLTRKKARIIEGIDLNFVQLNGDVKLRDNNTEMAISLQSINIDNVTQLQEKSQETRVSFLSPNFISPKIEDASHQQQQSQQQNKSLIKLFYQAKPIENPHIDTDVTLFMESIRLCYNPQLVERLTQFFKVKVQDEELKQAAWTQIEEKQEKMQSNIKSSMQNPSIMKLNVHIVSPIIIIPFNQKIESEIWVLNLGNLAVQTNEAVIRPNLTREEQYFDIYDISLKNIKMQYYKDIQMYSLKANDADANDENRSTINNIVLTHFDLIEDFTIAVNIRIIKEFAKLEIKEAPHMQIQGELPNLTLKLKPSLYQKILKIGNCFSVDQQETENEIADKLIGEEKAQEQQQLDKKQLMKNQIMMGGLWKQSLGLATWQKYTAILHGNYIYMYENPKDQQYSCQYWIKNSDVTLLDENVSGFKNSFYIKNKYTDCYFACDKPEMTQKWISAVQSISKQIELKKATSFTSDLENELNQVNQSKQIKQQSIQPDPNQKSMVVNFQIKNVNLLLIDDDSQEEFLKFQTQKIGLDLVQQPLSFQCQLSLGGMLLRDKIYQYQDQSLLNFISSGDPNALEQVDLIKVELRSIDPRHPNYQFINLSIDIQFGDLIINFKTDTLLKVLLFITNPEEKSQENNQQQLQQQRQSLTSTHASFSKQQTEVLSQETMSQTPRSNKSTMNLLIPEKQPTLMQANVNIHQIRVVMIHRKTHLKLASLSILNTAIIFQQKSDEMILTGTLGNLQLVDHSNYPKTLFQENQWKESKENEILGLLHKDGSSLLNIELRIFQENSPKIVNNVTTSVKVTISSIRINYMMQPVMRILDFLFVQILGPLSTPELFLDATQFSEIEAKEIKKRIEQATDPFAALRKIGATKLKSILADPTCMLLDVVLNNPVIELKPNPSAQEYLVLDLGKVKLFNTRKRDPGRILDSQIKEVTTGFSDSYCICFQDVQIKFMVNKTSENEGHYIEFTKFFHMNFCIEMLAFQNEYKFLYGIQVTLDKTMFIKLYLSPLIIKMSTADYNLIMRALFHNITYDDGCDQYLIHEFASQLEKQKRQLTKRVQASINIKKQTDDSGQLELFEDPKQINLEQSKDGQYPEVEEEELSGMSVSVDMENLTLFATENQDSVPFARVTINDLRVEFKKEVITVGQGKMKQQYQNSVVNVYGLELDGSFFTKINDEQYQETGMIRQIDVMKVYSLEDVKSMSNKLISGLDEHTEKGAEFHGFGFPKFPDTSKALTDQSKFNLAFELLMESSGYKNMKIQISDFKLRTEITPLLKLSSLASMDESTNPPLPFSQPPPELVEYLKQKQQLELEEQKRLSMKLNRSKKQKGQGSSNNLQKNNSSISMSIQITTRNIIICMPNLVSQSTIAVRGEFLIQLHFYNPLSALAISDEILDNKLTHETAWDLNKVSHFNITLGQLEIFICSLDQIMLFKEFNMVRKRPVLHPVNIEIIIKKYLVITQQLNNFFSKTIIDANIEQTSLRISARDLTLIQNTLSCLTSGFGSKQTQENNEQQQQKQEQSPNEQGNNVKQNQINKVSQDRQLKAQEDKLKRAAKLQELADNPSLRVESKITASLKTLQIIIINDLGGLYSPVMDVTISELVAKINQNNIQMNVSTDISLCTYYFNPRTSAWEPVIEDVSFQILYNFSEYSSRQQIIAVELNEHQECFNINVSTQFIATLMQMINMFKNQQPNTNDKKLLQISEAAQLLTEQQKSSKPSLVNIVHKKSEQIKQLQSQNSVQHVSPYVIQNQTGYVIQIKRDIAKTEGQANQQNEGQQIIQIKNNDSMPFSVEDDLDKLLQIHKITRVKNNSQQQQQQFDSTSESIVAHKIKLEILSNSPNSTFQTISGIDLDRMRCKQFQIQFQQQQQSDSLFFPATTEIKLDNITNRKILVISSTIVFQNNTSHHISLTFQNKKLLGYSYNKKFITSPNKQCAVPINMTGEGSTLIIKFESKNDQSPEIQLSQLLSGGCNKSYEFTIALNDKEGGQKQGDHQHCYYLILKVEKDQKNSYKTLIKIEPPYRLKNCLPKPIMFQILSHNKKTTLTKEIQTGEVYEEFRHSQNRNVYLKINMPGFFWSAEHLLFQGENIFNIPIKDINGNESYISVHQGSSTSFGNVNEDEAEVIQGCREYFFYCKAYIINESSYGLVIYTKNEQKNKAQNLMVGGQHPIYPEEQLDTNLVILGFESGNVLVLADRASPNAVSNEANAGGVGQTEIDVKIDLQQKQLKEYNKLSNVSLSQSKNLSQNNIKPPVLLPMGVCVTLQNVEQRQMLFTKKIQLSPRYIIINNSDNFIIIRQEGNQSKPGSNCILLSPHQRSPLYWFSAEKPKKININYVELPNDLNKESYSKYVDPFIQQQQFGQVTCEQSSATAKFLEENSLWQWSQEIDISNVGVVNFFVRQFIYKNQFLFLRTDTRDNESNIFIVIEKVPSDQIPYTLVNQLDDPSISLEIPHLPAKIGGDSIQSLGFSWENPGQSKEIQVDIISNKYQKESITFYPDQVNFFKKIKLKSSQQQQYTQDYNSNQPKYIKVTIEIEGFTKLIKFQPSTASEKQKQKQKEGQLLGKKNKSDNKQMSSIQENQGENEDEQEEEKKENQQQQQQNQQQKVNPKGTINATRTMRDTIQDEIEEELKEQEKESIDISYQPGQLIHQQISIVLKNIGISLIQNYQSEPKEPLFINIKNAEIILMTKEERTIKQIRIQYINIDNNSKHITSYPVILTPQQQGIYKNPDSNRFILNVFLEQNTAVKNIILLENITLELNPLTVRIEETLIYDLRDFFQELFSALGSASAQDNTTQVSKPNEKKQNEPEKKQLEEDSKNQIEKAQQKTVVLYNWQSCEIPPPSLPTFIDQIIISPIKLDLTFQSQSKTQQGGLVLLKTVTSALGVAISNIDEAPIKLNGIHLTQCFDTMQGITQKLTSHYKKQAITEVFKVLGSLNIIGNPVGLFHNISNGVTDLFEKPLEGFVQGPLEGGLGIVKGAGSLLKNTMAGTFNSVSKITGTVSTGISSLCMDDEYIEEREKLRAKKPKHLIDGMEQGAISIFRGFEKGITGIFLKPFEGAKKEGFKGLLKGTWQGISGLVIKPVAGILDAASKTAEGIKSTATHFDDKANEQRERAPRVFYGIDKIYKDFIDIDSEMWTVLQLYKKSRYMKAKFVQAFLIIPNPLEPNNQFVLILLLEALIYLSAKTQKTVWIVPNNVLGEFQLSDKGIVIQITQQNKYFKGNSLEVVLPDEKQRVYIYSQMKSLQQLLKEEQDYLSQEGYKLNKVYKEQKK